jgi:mannose-6-phosphate isomerase-like protein (cupin superfamily)
MARSIPDLPAIVAPSRGRAEVEEDTMRVRRVVTGQEAGGRSVVVEDELVEPVTVALFPGAEFHRIWGDDERPRLPSEGTTPNAPTHFPPAEGYRFGMFTMAPDSAGGTSDVDPEEAIAEIQRELPGLIDVLEPDGAGMHRTDTVDFNLIVSGEVWLELDDGAEVLLRAGDCVVQNGARHRWRNTSSEPCVMAVGQIGAARRPAAG